MVAGKPYNGLNCSFLYFISVEILRAVNCDFKHKFDIVQV